jgi:predicted outer membrane repeat protein
VRTSRFASLAIAALVAASVFSTAATINVPDEQPTIQAGIDAASHGDIVLVACGTYYEHDIAMKSGVCLASETGDPECVTVDAEYQGRFLYCDNVDSLASVVGITALVGRSEGSGGAVYCAGSALSFRECAFLYSGAEQSGGAFYCSESSPRLVDCAFQGNGSEWGAGGAIYCVDCPRLRLTGCSFVDHVIGDSGGAIACHYSTVVADDCTFTGNRALDGGAISVSSDGLLSMERCTFEGNSATIVGHGSGGAVSGYSTSASFTDCIFRNNAAVNGGGGAIAWTSSYSPPQAELELRYCLFEGNTAAGAGGAVYCRGLLYTPTNRCTFVGNSATEGSAFMMESYTMLQVWNSVLAFSASGVPVSRYNANSVHLSCCDVYGNADGDWVDCIADQYGVDGNFSEDPLFCDMTNDDFTLAANSPCLSGGNDCGELIGAHGWGCEESPVEPASWGSIKAMFR